MINLNRMLSVHVTESCNLKCQHCYQKSYDNTVIDIKYVDKAIRIFRPDCIVFYGGEPMLKPDILLEVMENYPNLYFWIYTNGTIFNQKIYEKLDKIIITLESYYFEEMSKFRPISNEQFKKIFKLINLYKNKIELLHNIYPTLHSKSFYKIAKIQNIKVQSYPLVLPEENMIFYPETIKNLHIKKEPLRKPKMRVLENGILTRDMRGIYNICHIDEWNENQDKLLPIHDKCLNCKYYSRCPACNMFPHFCKDVLDTISYPHFCKYTEEIWRI